MFLISAEKCEMVRSAAPCEENQQDETHEAGPASVSQHVGYKWTRNNGTSLLIYNHGACVRFFFFLFNNNFMYWKFDK